MRRLLLILTLAAKVYAQNPSIKLDANGLIDGALGKMSLPERTFAALPSASSNSTRVFVVTDCATSACTTGGGTTRVIVRSNGTSYEVITGAGGSTPTSAMSGGGSTILFPSPECASGTVEVSSTNLVQKNQAGATQQTVALSGAASQDFTIITGMNGTFAPSMTQLSETTQFAGSGLTSLKLSMGRPGSTNDELIPQTPFMQSSGDAWFVQDRPQAPVLGVSNTYTIAIGIRAAGGTGFVSQLTAGKVTYRVCGYTLP